MRRRVPILGAALTAAVVFGALPAFAVSGDLTSDPLPDRFRLVCTGTMTAAGQRTEIAADGLIDLAAGTVAGFGVGTAWVVLVTPSTVGFDSSDTSAERLAEVSDRPVERAGRKGPSTIVQGTLDRLRDRLRIAVLSTADPTEVVIAMDLGCRRESPLG